MRNRFDEQLELLNVELIRMGALCEDAISYASRTLMGEGDFANEVYKADHEIDQKEREIESLCMRLLLQQQPVAKDLRRIPLYLPAIPEQVLKEPGRASRRSPVQPPRKPLLPDLHG